MFTFQEIDSKIQRVYLISPSKDVNDVIR